jgi:hypothetical protein
MTLAHGPFIAGVFAASTATMVSSGQAHSIPPAQNSAPGVSLAAPPPPTTHDIAEPRAYAPTDTLCMSYWDPGTHMTKAEWRRTCERTTQNGTWAGDYR